MDANIVRRLDLAGSAIGAAREGLTPREDALFLDALRRMIEEREQDVTKKPVRSVWPILQGRAALN